MSGIVYVNMNNSEESPLLLVAASGDDEMLQLLLAQANNTVDVNQRCSLGATAFHAAANAGDLKVCLRPQSAMLSS